MKPLADLGEHLFNAEYFIYPNIIRLWSKVEVVSEKCATVWQFCSLLAIQTMMFHVPNVRLKITAYMRPLLHAGKHFIIMHVLPLTLPCKAFLNFFKSLNACRKYPPNSSSPPTYVYLRALQGKGLPLFSNYPGRLLTATNLSPKTS